MSSAGLLPQCSHLERGHGWANSGYLGALLSGTVGRVLGGCAQCVVSQDAAATSSSGRHEGHGAPESHLFPSPSPPCPVLHFTHLFPAHSYNYTCRCRPAHPRGCSPSLCSHCTQGLAVPRGGVEEPLDLQGSAATWVGRLQEECGSQACCSGSVMRCQHSLICTVHN